MALLEMFGFDLEDANTVGKFSVVQGNGANSIADVGRFIGRDALGGYANNSGAMKFLAAPTTLIMQTYFKVGVSLSYLKFRTFNTVVATIKITSGGVLTFYRGTELGTSLGNYTITPYSTSLYYRLDVKVLWNNSTGTVLVKVNGVEALNLTSQNTNDSLANPNNLWFTQSVSTGVNYLDDMLIMDTTGSAPFNDFLSDYSIDTRVPSADVLQGWGRSTGSTNYTLIDDLPATTTGYVQAAATNTDRYECRLPLNGLSTHEPPLAVQASAVAVSIVPGSSIKVGMELNASIVEATHVQSGTQVAVGKLSETKPGGGAWTAKDLDNTRFNLVLV